METTVKTVDIQDADLNELLALVREGTKVTFTENGKPVAHLLPMNTEKQVPEVENSANTEMSKNNDPV